MPVAKTLAAWRMSPHRKPIGNFQSGKRPRRSHGIDDRSRFAFANEDNGMRPGSAETRIVGRRDGVTTFQQTPAACYLLEEKDGKRWCAPRHDASRRMSPRDNWPASDRSLSGRNNDDAGHGDRSAVGLGRAIKDFVCGGAGGRARTRLFANKAANGPRHVALGRLIERILCRRGQKSKHTDCVYENDDVRAQYFIAPRASATRP